MNVGNIADLLVAAATLLTAVGGFITVMKKIGVHGDKIDAIATDVNKLASATSVAAQEVATVAPAVEAVIDAAKK